MIPPNQTVFIVDDNRGMRDSMALYLRCVGLSVELFDSARAFIDSNAATRPGCLVLDLKMPEMGGLDLQKHLNEQGFPIPTIVVSGQAAVTDAVQSMKLGSFDFLEKPFSSEEFLEKVLLALEYERKTRKSAYEKRQRVERFRKLSPRERQILSLVVAGEQSKTIADKCGLSRSTVDNHRANIMRKLGARTSSDLTKIALLTHPEIAAIS